MRLASVGLILLALAVGSFVVLGTSRLAARDAGDAARIPVLVELFTSEGCSSCPAADRVLARLAAEQPVATAQVIALSEHVDYWNRLGWRDPFSSAVFSARQSTYDRAVFRSGEIYTPQAVIGGQLQLIGSDYRAALDAIARVAAQPHPIALTVSAKPEGSDIGVRVGAAAAGHAAISADVEILIAVAEDGLTRAVLAGENRGRTLSHMGVVRELLVAGRLTPRTPVRDVIMKVTVRPEWDLAHVRLVVVAQEVESRRVLGAASAPLS